MKKKLDMEYLRFWWPLFKAVAAGHEPKSSLPSPELLREVAAATTEEAQMELLAPHFEALDRAEKIYGKEKK